MNSNVWRVNVARRFGNYLLSAVVASLIYVGWVAVVAEFSEGGSAHPGLRFALGFAFVFLFIGGFALALLAMTIPWAVAVWVQMKTRWHEGIYFAIVGAILVFLLGCAAGSIMPKPFWVDEQSFLEGAVITAQRQGLCLAVSGIGFGVSYWFLERRSRAT